MKATCNLQLCASEAMDVQSARHSWQHTYWIDIAHATAQYESWTK